jgi:hypothetical protein
MPWHLRACLVAFRRRVTTSFMQTTRVAMAAFLAALAHACTSAPTSPVVGPDPSDPRVRTPPVSYSSTLGPFVSRRPADPAPWREQNQQAAPQPKQ